MGDIVFEWVDASDVRMTEVDDLRFAALFEPFGVVRLDDWNDSASDKRHLIAIRDGSVVGYACLILEGDEGQVRQVCVVGELQGSGVGSGLMSEVRAEAVRLGLRLLWLNARTMAESFYGRLGWTTTSDEFPSGRTGLPHVRMELPLAPQL